MILSKARNCNLHLFGITYRGKSIMKAEFIDQGNSITIDEFIFYADGMQHSLTFCFNTDQSVFLPFIRKLKKMVENADKQN